MFHSGPEYTTILVEYKQQVIAYMLIDFIQSIITQSFDFIISVMGSRKPVKSLILLFCCTLIVFSLSLPHPAHLQGIS